MDSNQYRLEIILEINKEIIKLDKKYTLLVRIGLLSYTIHLASLLIWGMCAGWLGISFAIVSCVLTFVCIVYCQMISATIAKFYDERDRIRRLRFEL